MLSAAVRINRDTIGHVEAVRLETRNDGTHLYGYRLWEDGRTTTHGTLPHQESDGPYVLLHKVLGAILKQEGTHGSLAASS